MTTNGRRLTQKQDRKQLAAWLRGDCANPKHRDNLGDYSQGSRMYCIYCTGELWLAANEGNAPWDVDSSLVPACSECGAKGFDLRRGLCNDCALIHIEESPVKIHYAGDGCDSMHGRSAE